MIPFVSMVPLSKAPFDFCGGMMFQLVLSNKLREHLALVAQGAGEQPMVFDSFKPRTVCGSGTLEIWYVGTECR
jgi:hypothetical protein